MNLEDLGYHDRIGKWISENYPSELEPGRIVAEHRERYIVHTGKREFDAEITGNLRFSAAGREDFPAVGDWVALSVFDSGTAVIHRIMPRQSVLSRKAPGQTGEIQIIAANIDVALIVQAAGRDFNINRLERYQTICHSSHVKPVIVVTKTDLIPPGEREELIGQLEQRLKNVPLFAVSNVSREGYGDLRKIFKKGKTYCLLGSSGAGKSTLLNNLHGEARMQTGSISQSTGKGKHVTSHRELTVLEHGGILIDNPGMREVGIADMAEGLETTFDRVQRLSKKCKFKDCTHTNESGCRVIEAVEEGTLDRETLENYRKLQKERAHFETSRADRRKKEKVFGKVLKDYLKKDVKGKNMIR